MPLGEEGDIKWCTLIKGDYELVIVRNVIGSVDYITVNRKIKKKNNSGNPVSQWLIPSAKWMQFCSATLLNHFKITFKIQVHSLKYLLCDMISSSCMKYWSGNTSPTKKSSLRELNSFLLLQNLLPQYFSAKICIKVPCAFVKLHTPRMIYPFLAFHFIHVV